VVAQLVQLKLRLLWNGLKADWQRRFGFPATMIALAVGAIYLAGRYNETIASLSADARIEFTLWGALAFFALWVTLPVVIFPLDENLDPAQFAMAPVPPLSFITGLGLAALIAPSVVVPIIVLGTNVAIHASVLPIAVWSSLLFLVLMIVSGQLFTTVISAVLRTRRGRDFAMFIVLGIGLIGFASQQLVRRAIDALGLEGAVLANQVGDAAVFVPPVAAQRITTEALAGNYSGVVTWSIVTVAWIGVLAWVWNRLLQWMLTTPEANAGPAKRSRSAGLAGRAGWSAPIVLARKELRFFVRDPRQRLVWTGAVIFLGLVASSILVGTTGIGQFRTREWIPLLAPGLVLFVGLPIALNMFGWERNAASFLFVLPTTPRRLILGKNLATAIALVLETAVLAILLASLSSSWSVLRFVPALTVAAVGCQLAVGNLVSVITPLRLPREGTDVFSQATEQGCLAIFAQLTSFAVIGLMLVLPASFMVLAIAFGQVLEPWMANGFSVVWGLFFYLASVSITSRILNRRMPEVVNWVQTV
jgi:ABC-2 type transport system permease protein